MKVAIVNTPFMQKLAITDEEKIFWSSLWGKRILPGKYRIDKSQIEDKLRSNVRADSTDYLTFDLLEVPMWYVYLSSVLSSSNIPHELFDLNKLSGATLSEDDISSCLGDGNHNVYLISSFTNNAHFSTRVVRAIRRNNPKAIIVMGGPHATCRDQEVLRSGVDFVVRGEGEITLESLLNSLQQEKDPSEVNGLSYMRLGEIIRTPNRQPISKLDDLPLPNYGILPREYENTFYTRLFTSRGCPMHCAFCSDVLWNNQRVRKKSSQRIGKELEIIKSHINFVELYVSDDTFSVDKRYSMAVAEILSSAGIDWSCETRVDMVTQELLAHYRSCGCVEVDYGAESAVQTVLDASNKKTRVEQIERAFKMAKNAGLHVHTNWMVGLPADTPTYARHTIDFACRMLDDGIIDTADYFITVPYPGTPIASNPQNYGYGIRTMNWDLYREDSLPVFDLPGFSAVQIYSVWKQGLLRIAESMQKGAK